MDLTEILTYFTAGERRLYAAGLLFLCVWLLERTPLVKQWINVDGWKPGADSADHWLTSARKKWASALVLSLVPSATLLQSGAPWLDVAVTAATALVGSAGLNAWIGGKKDG